MDETQEKLIRVVNGLGLHARPAGQISREAQKYQATITLSCQDAEADAKSILDLLTLAAPKGTELRLRAQGPDAPEALAGISRLFEDMFGETA